MSENSETVVLVADDEPSTLALVVEHVRAKGYKVIEASDGDMAWQLAHQHLPDLVILDVMMPGMSGWEVCRKIRESLPLAHTGVVMLTGIGQNLNEMTSPLYGADAHVDKPFEFSDLDEKIEYALSERRGGAYGRADHADEEGARDSNRGTESAPESSDDEAVPTTTPTGSRVPRAFKTNPPSGAKTARGAKKASGAGAKPKAAKPQTAKKAKPRPKKKAASKKPAPSQKTPSKKSKAKKKTSPEKSKKATKKKVVSSAAKKSAAKKSAAKRTPSRVKKSAKKQTSAKKSKKTGRARPAAKKKKKR